MTTHRLFAATTRTWISSGIATDKVELGKCGRWPLVIGGLCTMVFAAYAVCLQDALLYL